MIALFVVAVFALASPALGEDSEAERLRKHMGLPPRAAPPRAAAGGGGPNSAPEKKRVRLSTKRTGPLGTPFPPRVACNATELYERTCAPVGAACLEPVDVRTKHGIGNALQTTYLNAAVGVFERGCAPAFAETAGKFRLQDWVAVPERVPTRLHVDACVQWALTQPRAALTEVVASARGDGVTPVVAIHVRTGWVDTVRDARGWAGLECPARAPPPAGGGDLRRLGGLADDDGGAVAVDAGNLVVGGRAGAPNVDLRELAAVAARDADAAYGPRGWDLYVASDAPGVKAWVASTLKDRAREVRVLDGAIGHNYHSAGTADADITSLADLILLGEADVLIHYSSKFPSSAANRNFCPGLRMEIHGHPRHGLAAVSKALNTGKTDLSKVDAAWRCRDLGATTVQECACMYKATHA